MPLTTGHRYLIALGSNVRHSRHGEPERVLAAALERLEAEGMDIVAAAPIIASDPIGPSIRRYANSAAIVATRLAPSELLALLKRVEREFGRRAGGQRWRARVLDLDVVLWSGGPYVDRSLTIPHPLFRREVCGADASGAFDRADFGMKQYTSDGAGHITLRIQVEAMRE